MQVLDRAGGATPRRDRDGSGRLLQLELERMAIGVHHRDAHGEAQAGQAAEEEGKQRCGAMERWAVHSGGCGRCRAVPMCRQYFV